MIKGIHSADHHLTIKRGRKTIPYQFENQTIEFNAYSDYLFRKFESIVDYAVAQKNDFFIMAGDVFHTTNVQRYEIDRYLKSIKKLSDAGIVTVECPGNHTTPTSLTGIHALYMIKYYPNVYVSDDYGKTIDVKWGISFGKKGKANIVICPYLKNPPRSFYRLSDIDQEEYLLGRKQEITEQDLVRDEEIRVVEENKYFSQAIERALRKLNDELPKDEINIFVGHFNVDGAKLSGEREFSVGNGWGVSKNVFDVLDAYTYIAMGHIHTHQVLSEKGNAFYSGSIAQLNFGEIEDKFVNEISIKGAHDMTVNKMPITQEYQFKILNVGDCTEFVDFNEEILKMAKEHDWSNSIVEVRGKLTAGQYRTLNGSAISAEFIKAGCLDFNGFNFERVSVSDISEKAKALRVAENNGDTEITSVLDALSGNEQVDIVRLTEVYASDKNKEKILIKMAEYLG